MSSEELANYIRALEAAFLLDGQGATQEGATELWLVRHGDAYDGVRGADPPLSALGQQQAGRLAERIRRLPHAAIYASPLRRARETAAALAADVSVDERLVEGRTEIIEGRLVPTEPEAAVQARMRAAMDDIVAAHPGTRVIVVSHAYAILAHIADVLHTEVASLRLLPYFTSVSIVRVLGERRMVGSLIDVSHLEPA